MDEDRENPSFEKVVHKGYPFSVWMLTILFGDLFMILFFLIRDGAVLSELIPGGLLILIFSIVLSIPALLVFIGLFYLLKKWIVNMMILKLVLSLYAILSVILMSQLVLGEVLVGFTTIYSMANIISTIVVKIKKVPI